MSNNLTQQEEIDAILKKFNHDMNNLMNELTEESPYPAARTALTQMLIKAQERVLDDITKNPGGLFAIDPT